MSAKIYYQEDCNLSLLEGKAPIFNGCYFVPSQGALTVASSA